MKPKFQLLDFRLFFPRDVGGFGKLVSLLISRVLGKLALTLFLLWSVATSPDEMVNLTLIFGLANVVGTTLLLSSLLLSPRHHADRVPQKRVETRNYLMSRNNLHSIKHLSIASLFVVLVLMLSQAFIGFQILAVVCFFGIWLYFQISLVGTIANLVGSGMWFFLSIVQLCPAVSFSLMALLSNFDTFASPSLLFMLGILVGSLFQVWLVSIRFNFGDILVGRRHSDEKQLRGHKFNHPTMKQLIAITVPFCLFYFSDELVLFSLDANAETISVGLLFGKIFFALVVNFIFSSFFFFLENISQQRRLGKDFASLVLLLASAFIFSLASYWLTVWGGIYADLPQIEINWLYFSAFFSKALMSVVFVILILNSMNGGRAVQPMVVYVYPVLLPLLIAKAGDDGTFVIISLAGVFIYVFAAYRELYLNYKPPRMK